MNITHELATRIVESQPTATARERARAGLLDFIAVTLPVLRGETADSGLAALQSVCFARDSQTRALLLGYAGHALDFDDFHPDFRGHPGTVILPALLAFAGEHPCTPDAFLDACVTGVETAGRLGLAAGQRHYQQGFHNTATLGTLAAAAAMARLSGASVIQTEILLGIAATQASGLRAQFGSAVKPLHAGLAAQAAVFATKLALAGFDGQRQGVIDGFLAACCAGSDPDRLVAQWGAPWRIEVPGLEFKPYATCSGTHSAADAARQLRKRWLASHASSHPLAEAVVRIEVAFPPGGDIAAAIRQPANGIEARFSLEYVIASCLLYDGVALEDVAEGPVNPEIAALAARVERCPDPSAPPDEHDPSARFHEVRLFFDDGQSSGSRVTRQQSLSKPVDLVKKLQSCLAGASVAERQHIVALCELRTQDALSGLIKLLDERLRPLH